MTDRRTIKPRACASCGVDISARHGAAKFCEGCAKIGAATISISAPVYDRLAGVALRDGKSVRATADRLLIAALDAAKEGA